MRFRFATRMFLSVIGAYVLGSCSDSGDVITSAAPQLTIVAPADVTAAWTSETEIGLTWTDVSDSENRYEIQRTNEVPGVWDDLPNAPADATSATDVTPTVFERHRYRVRACDEATCTAWTHSLHVHVVAPAAPLSLTASKVSSTEILVEWVPADAFATRFEIQRQDVAVPGVWDGMDVDSADTSLNDTNVETAVTYRYRIRACRGTACSAWTGSLRISGDVAPAAPSGVNIIPLGPLDRLLAWTDNSSNEARFDIQRMSLSNNGVWVGLPKVPANVATAGDATIIMFDVHVYRVRACHLVAGCSAWALSPMTQTLEVSITDAVATQLSISEIELAWTADIDNGTHTISRRTLPDGAWAVIGTAEASGYTDNTALPNEFYVYRISTCRLIDCAAVNISASTRPNAPANLVLDAGAPEEVVLMWTDSSDNETRFDVYQRLQTESGWSAWTSLEPAPAGTESYGGAALVSEVTSQFRVRACNPHGCSAFSNVLTVEVDPD